MIKYKNPALRNFNLTIFLHLFIFFGIIISTLLTPNDELANAIFPCTIFVLLLIFYDFIFYFYLANQNYLTFYNDNCIEQRLFFKKKKINFNEIKYIYYIGTAIIPSRIKYSKDLGKINIKLKKAIMKELKQEVCIIINVGDNRIHNLLDEKCSNIQKFDLNK